MEEEKFDLESFPTSESAKKMLGYVTSGFYDKSYVGKWLYQVMGLEYDEAGKLVEELAFQMFPETATWGLMYHEIKWGLPVRPNLLYEERRRLIYQKRDYRAPMTPYRMEQYLKDFTGFGVRITDISDPGNYGFVAPHPNVFKAYFLGEGTPDSKKIRKELDKLKQSHTIYTINYRSEFDVDYRELEKIELKKIIFDLSVEFWYCYVLNGKWNLNGNVWLNSKRRYNLELSLKNFMGELRNPINAKASVGFVADLRPHMVEVPKMISNYTIRNPNYAESAIVGIFKITQRGQIEAERIVKSKDCWFLDGALTLNSSGKLNSIYREETIE